MKILKKIISLVMVIIIFLGVIGIYTTFIERKLLSTKKYEININENSQEELKIVQFTDTHLGIYYSLDDLEKVVENINKQKADIVIFTGDLMDNASQYEHIYEISEVLGKIEATIGKYAIYGNRDYGGGAVRYYEEIMEESGFELLVNESKVIELENTNINIFGGDDALMGNYNSEETIEGINNNDVNLLILHEPDLIDDFKEYPIDLALSGHSHGGQVYIPFIGPLATTELAEKYTKGFYNLNNSTDGKLYVNSGLGNTKVPFRFFNKPQITVIKLKI